MGGGCAVAALSGRIKGAALLLAALTLAGCTVQVQVETDPPTPAPTAPAEVPAATPAATPESPAEPAEPVYDVTPGSETYRDFTLDNVCHSNIGDIHFNLYVPESYDGSTPYALFVTLPGWQGLYFQGVGVNLQTETFGFAAQEYGTCWAPTTSTPAGSTSRATPAAGRRCRGCWASGRSFTPPRC